MSKLFKWMKNSKNTKDKEVVIQEKKEEENVQEAASQADPPNFLGRRRSSTLLSTIVEHDEEDSDIELPAFYSSKTSSIIPNMKFKDRKRSSSSTASSEGYQIQTSRSTLADDTLDTIHEDTLSSSSSASSYFTAQGSMNTISSSCSRRDSFPSFTAEVTTASDAEIMQEKRFEELTARVDKLEGQMEHMEKLVIEIRGLVSMPERNKDVKSPDELPSMRLLSKSEHPPGYAPVKTCDQQVIMWLTQRVTYWKFLGRRLGLPENVLSRIEADNPNADREQCYQMFLQWKKSDPENYTYSVLGDALQRESRELYNEFVEKVHCVHVEKSSRDSEDEDVEVRAKISTTSSSQLFEDSQAAVNTQSRYTDSESMKIAQRKEIRMSRQEFAKRKSSRHVPTQLTGMGWTKGEKPPFDAGIEEGEVTHEKIVQRQCSDSDFISKLSEVDSLDNMGECIPEGFNPVTTLLRCAHDGKHYHNEANGFSLEIPEGAIPEGESITIDIGVALYGPFQYPEGLRPVSPVFWLCVRDKKFFSFLRPVRVTISHFLRLENHTDIESLGLAFLKGNHNMNAQKAYQLHQAEGSSLFEPHTQHGVLETTHFCSLCISGKISDELIRHATFCIYAAIPHVISPKEPSHAYFFVTFLLRTCLKTVEKQIKMLRLGSNTLMYKREFQFHQDELKSAAMEIDLPQSSPAEWTIGLFFTETIMLKEIDFFVGEITNITIEQLKLKEEEGMYPPRFHVVISCTPDARQSQARIRFRGATSNLRFDIPLNPLSSQATPTSPTISSTAYGSTTSLADQSTSLGIDDLFDATQKLSDVASRWWHIGLALKLSSSQLDSVHSKSNDTLICLTEILKLWLNRNYNVAKYGEPTWEMLRKAVRNPVGGNSEACASNI